MSHASQSGGVGDAPPAPAARFRTALICHADDPMDRDGLARWLASFTDLTAIVAIHEPGGRLWRRIRREVRRVGPLRFADVLAFRLYYKLRLAKADRAWVERTLADLRGRYPEPGPATRVLNVASPNAPEVRPFLREAAPDVMIARCKSILKSSIFSVPGRGTFVMHPGVCPEYRNAHGCFWALARNDPSRVGMTLLRIDKGVDTGPVFGYYGCDFDERTDSHIVIQHRVVFDNLPALERRLAEVAAGTAEPLDTTGRESAEWGQPWLSAYLSWRRRARRRARSAHADHPAVS